MGTLNTDINNWINGLISQAPAGVTDLSTADPSLGVIYDTPTNFLANQANASTDNLSTINSGSVATLSTVSDVSGQVATAAGIAITSNVTDPIKGWLSSALPSATTLEVAAIEIIIILVLLLLLAGKLEAL